MGVWWEEVVEVPAVQLVLCFLPKGTHQWVWVWVCACAYVFFIPKFEKALMDSIVLYTKVKINSFPKKVLISTYILYNSTNNEIIKW